jgi:hypothetical protein
MGRPTSGYKLKSGDPATGVTTILSRWKDSGALLHWAAEQGRLMERGIIKNLYDKRDEAADIGTLAHDMCDSYLKGNDPYEVLKKAEMDQEKSNKADQAYKMFLDWWQQTGLKVHDSEMPLVSETHKFGGTPDWILETPRGYAIGDIKTSKAIYRDMLLQVAAYKILWEENHPDKLITGGFYICRFSKDFPDWECRHYGELKDAEEQFLLLNKAYALDKELKKRAA